MQTLNFIGSGSAFNTELGNNSAYLKNRDTLVLIDCGGTTFERIQKLKLLDGVTDINILITHLHPDHIGSLGDLIFYAHYVLKLKPKVFFPLGNQVENLLSCMGVKKHLYEMRTINIGQEYKVTFGQEESCTIEYFKSTHVEELPSFGFAISLPNGKKILYSGDSNSIPDKMFIRFVRGEFQEFYQDTCGLDYAGNVHLSLEKLFTLIPEPFRWRVYCMHLDQAFRPEEAENYGFKVVENDTV